MTHTKPHTEAIYRAIPGPITEPVKPTGNLLRQSYVKVDTCISIQPHSTGSCFPTRGTVSHWGLNQRSEQSANPSLSDLLFSPDQTQEINKQIMRPWAWIKGTAHSVAAQSGYHATSF